MEGVRFVVEPHGADWSIKHNNGYLGHVRSRSEALEIARMLASWTAAQGRATEIELARAPGERRSFVDF